MASNKEILRKLRSAMRDVRSWMDTPDFDAMDLSHEWVASLGTWIEALNPKTAYEYYRLRDGIYGNDAVLGDLEDFLATKIGGLEAQIEMEERAAGIWKAHRFLLSLKKDLPQHVEWIEKQWLDRYHDILVRYVPHLS